MLTHQDSMTLMKLMDRIRSENGIVYPASIESVSVPYGDEEP